MYDDLVRTWIFAVLTVAVAFVVAGIVYLALTLRSVFSDGLPSNVMVGHLRPYPWWVYLIEMFCGLTVVAAVVYLDRRR